MTYKIIEYIDLNVDITKLNTPWTPSFNAICNCPRYKRFCTTVFEPVRTHQRPFYLQCSGLQDTSLLWLKLNNNYHGDPLFSQEFYFCFNSFSFFSVLLLDLFFYSLLLSEESQLFSTLHCLRQRFTCALTMSRCMCLSNIVTCFANLRMDIVYFE